MTFPTTLGSHARARCMNTLLAIAAVALSGVLMTADAQAAPPPPPAGEDETISVQGGYAEFHNYGDILEVSDGVLNGRGVRMEFGGLGSSPIRDYQLSDYEADGEPVKMNLDLLEHQRVVMRVCYTVDHLSTYCSEWQEAIT